MTVITTQNDAVWLNKLVAEAIRNNRAANNKLEVATREAADFMTCIWNEPSGVGELAREIHSKASEADGHAKARARELDRLFWRLTAALSDVAGNPNAEYKPPQAPRLNRIAA